MAHIGKNYRLHFRRDACLGCFNYRVAMAHTWRLFGDIFRTIPELPTINVPLTNVVAVEPQDVAWPAWESGLITTAGKTFSLHIQLDGWNQPLQQTHLFLKFVRLGVTRASVILHNDLIRNCDRFSTPTPFEPLGDWDESFWGSEAGFTRIQISPLNW